MSRGYHYLFSVIIFGMKKHEVKWWNISETRFQSTIFNIPPKSDLTFAKAFTPNAFLLLGRTDNSLLRYLSCLKNKLKQSKEADNV